MAKINVNKQEGRTTGWFSGANPYALAGDIIKPVDEYSYYSDEEDEKQPEQAGPPPSSQPIPVPKNTSKTTPFVEYMKNNIDNLVQRPQPQQPVQRSITQAQTQAANGTGLAAQLDVKRSFVGCGLDFPEHFIFLGRNKTGKTCAIRHLIRDIMCMANVSSVWWFGLSSRDETWLPEKRRFDSVSKSKIESIAKLGNNPNFKGYFHIIVLDDVAGTSFADKWWAKMITWCRHQNVMFIVGCQYFKIIPPIFREQAQRYIITSTTDDTKEGLGKLSCDKKEFKKQFTKQLRVGKPLLFSTCGGGQELIQLELPYVGPEDILGG
jgi:hypothetical protein